MSLKEPTLLQVLRCKKSRKKGEVITPYVESKEEKVLRLKALFEQGLYNPRCEDIAEAIMSKLDMKKGEKSRK